MLAECFRRALPDYLLKNRVVSGRLRRRMLVQRHVGFSAQNEVRGAAEDAEGRKTLAGTMLRAPRSREEMTCDATAGTAICRSKMHAGLKRSFQVMPGPEWSASVRKHSADRYEHLARYVG